MKSIFPNFNLIRRRKWFSIGLTTALAAGLISSCSFFDKNGSKKSDILTNLYHNITLSDNDGSWQEILDEYIKKNPLDIIKLNGNPEMKAEVLKRTGIRDYSKIASGLDIGII